MKYLKKIKTPVLALAVFSIVVLATGASYYWSGTQTAVWSNGTGSAVVLGEIVDVGTYSAAVATDAVANGSAGTVGLEGVYKIPKASGTTFSAGVPLFWTGTALTGTVATGYRFVGFANSAGNNGETYGFVRLAPYYAEGPRYLTATTSVTLSKYDFMGGHCVINCNATTMTLTLPAVADIPKGALLTVKKTHGSSAGAITIDGNASETIEAGATYTAVDAADDVATFLNTGSAWVLVDAYIP
jgi:predicted RecA/RadA family phage recombinase